MWKQVLIWGLVLSAGTLSLQGLDYLRVVRFHASDLYTGLMATAFLAVGVAVGAHLFAPRPAAFDGNPQALSALGISPRELSVLKALAAGQSNKEIARALDVSPNTVKTHVARLFEKLGAKRRTDAINRARELGILS